MRAAWSIVFRRVNFAARSRGAGEQRGIRGVVEVLAEKFVAGEADVLEGSVARSRLFAGDAGGRTPAPAAKARAAVSSALPLSTTRTSAAPRARQYRTVSATHGASLSAGMTTVARARKFAGSGAGLEFGDIAR